MVAGKVSTSDTTSDSGFAYFLRSQFFGAVKRNFRLLIDGC